MILNILLALSFFFSVFQMGHTLLIKTWCQVEEQNKLQQSLTSIMLKGGQVLPFKSCKSIKLFRSDKHFVSLDFSNPEILYENINLEKRIKK